jgi:hypothetical protein
VVDRGFKSGFNYRVLLNRIERRFSAQIPISYVQ